MADTKDSASRTPSEQARERRRSIRVHILMPVTVRGTTGTEQFQEQTQTIAVSAHGCLVRLAAQVVQGQEMSIVNPKTAEEVSCRVISLGQRDREKREIGVEFAEPSPRFWRITFPPENWDPSERKLPSPMPPRSTPRR